jgi:hypothetical protein
LKFSRSLSGKHFVSKAGKHYFTQRDHDKKHREAVTRKLEKIHLNNLRQKLHSARMQYKAMAIVKDAIEMPFARR